MIDMDAVYGIPGKHPVASFQFPALLATLLAGGLSLLGSKVAVLEVFYTISSLLGILVSAGLYSFSFSSKKIKIKKERMDTILSFFI
jgi:allantoin permease